MDQVLREWGTLAIAVWGAVTGTISLVLAIRRYRRDRPRLLVEPSWEYVYSGFPPDVALLVKVVNAGRRPTTVGKVFAELPPSAWWRVPLWWLGKRRRVFFRTREIRTELTEGRSETLRFSGDKLPKDIELYDLSRIIVRDETGRSWKSSRHFRQAEVRDLFEAEGLRDAEFGDKEDDRYVAVKLVRMRKDVGIYLEQKESNKTRRQFIRVEDHDQALKNYQEATGLAQSYVANELDDVLDSLAF